MNQIAYVLLLTNLLKKWKISSGTSKHNVEVQKKTLYGKLVLEEKNYPQNAPEKFAKILLKLKPSGLNHLKNETPYLYFVNKLKTEQENGIVMNQYFN